MAQAGLNYEKKWGSKISLDCPFDSSLFIRKFLFPLYLKRSFFRKLRFLPSLCTRSHRSRSRTPRPPPLSYCRRRPRHSPNITRRDVWSDRGRSLQHCDQSGRICMIRSDQHYRYYFLSDRTCNTMLDPYFYVISGSIWMTCILPVVFFFLILISTSIKISTL